MGLINYKSARLVATAKLNLGLRVLYKRPDGFHELRTLFQSIGLADWIDVQYAASRSREVTLESELNIADNLIVRAANALLDETGRGARVSFKLTKRIPMGGGLGGGSTDAAAVLLGLPALMGIRVPMELLSRIGASLGSDVPFFLHGGRALGLGRGTELYPLPDGPSEPVLLVTPGFPISTPEAYQTLSARLGGGAFSTAGFEDEVWRSDGRRFYRDKRASLENDFEGPAFAQFPELAAIQRKLWSTGASPAGMTGSGSTMYGVYENRRALAAAEVGLKRWRTFRTMTVSRVQFRKLWFKPLGEHSDGLNWPPSNSTLKNGD